MDKQGGRGCMEKLLYKFTRNKTVADDRYNSKSLTEENIGLVFDDPNCTVGLRTTKLA